MHIRKIRIALALVAVAAAAAALATTLWQHGDTRTTAKIADPHAPVNMSKAQAHRILAATEAANNSAPQSELVAQGRTLFRSNDLAKTGESCQSCHTEGGANPDIGTIVHPRPTPANDFHGPRDPLALYAVA